MHGMYVGKFLPATIDADYELLKWQNDIQNMFFVCRRMVEKQKREDLPCIFSVMLQKNAKKKHWCEHTLFWFIMTVWFHFLTHSDNKRYCEDSLRFLIDACYEKNSEVQQVSLWLSNSLPLMILQLISGTTLLQIVAQGIGVSAEFGGSIFKSHIKGRMFLSFYCLYMLFTLNNLLAEALAGLKAILRDQETLHLDNLPAHVAAVSALGKICFYHHERLDEVKLPLLSSPL